MARPLTEQDVVACRAVPPVAAHVGLPASAPRGCALEAWSRLRCCGWALIYLVALAALFVTAFWTVDFGTDVVREWNLDNFTKLFEQEVYRTVILRTIMVAVAVTVIDAVLALADRVLHGQGRRPDDGQDHGGRGADAAVGELPGQGVRLAGDDQARAECSRPPSAGRLGSALTAVIITLAYSGSRSWCCRCTRASSGCRTRCSRHRRTSAPDPAGRCA